MTDVFQPAYDYIEGQLDTFLGDRLGAVMADVEGPLRLMLVLYVVLFGFALFRGVSGEPVMDGVMRMIKLCFIYVVGTTAAYSDWVTDPLFHDLPDALAHAISGDGATGIGQAFDQFVGRGFHLATICAKTANIANPLPWVTSVCVYIATAIAAGIGFCIVMIAVISLALLVATGPIFVACLVFEPTRRFFYGWLSQAVNYLILFALILAVFRLVLSLIEARWDEIIAQPDPQMAALIFCLHCVIASIFFFGVPRLAAGIASGAVAGTSDFFRSVGWASAAALGRASLPALRTSSAAGGSLARTSPSSHRRAA